jgi:glycosyltransferase involved in cell wall biosynthesis
MRRPRGPIKLVHIVTSPATAWSFLRGQLRFMRERGLDVTVIASPGRALDDVGASEGVNTIAVPMPRNPSPVHHSVALLRLVRILRQLRPDIVHSATPQASFLGGVASWTAGVPVRVMTLHGIGTEAVAGRSRPLFHRLEQLSCGAAQRIYCVGDSLRTQALSLKLATPDKLRVLAGGTCNGIDIARFSPTPAVLRRSEALRDRLKLQPNAPVIGFVGRLVRFKGVADLIAAFKLLKPQFPGLTLLLVGPNEKYEQLGSGISAEINHDSQIVPTGFLEDTPAVYPLMNVLALPSYREGYGYVLMEAAAMGVPTIATRITGCVDAVVDGQTGTLVPPGNVEALAGALRTYLSDAELCRRHGRAGQERVIRDFQPEPIWEALYDEYRELLEQHGAANAAGLQMTNGIEPVMQSSVLPSEVRSN